jgi:23S rRNA (cytidine1920-2'-O)/16S rRNA (cytidine1409-2'-O)-methyltransferase
MGQLKSSLKLRKTAMNKGARAKQRLDVLLVERGLANSREQARRLILAGKVTVGGAHNPKPGQQFALDADVQVQEPERFVSRGGLKLESALDAFRVEVAGKICADIGASTGGFTDCLLQRGAARVFAVDVGATQMHERIRHDPRVVLIEHTNARELRGEQFGGYVPVVCAIDVSFISILKVLPSVRSIVPDGATCIALIKPQFEAERSDVSRGKGVIRDAAVHRRILMSVIDALPRIGWRLAGLMNSPITGGSGNREFLAHLVAEDPHSPEVPPAAQDIDIDALLHEGRNTA